MARLPVNASSTLRNRSRITNKTKFKLVLGSIEMDEDDEDAVKANLISTAGVDLEDANEHHLQAALASSSSKNKFIPTPDSTGVVANYDQLYAQRVWKDDYGHNAHSMDVDQTIEASLQDGFTYYLDERDKVWLDRNNEEARGEGTSANGALSSVPCNVSSPRGKGKESELKPSKIVTSEDEFELVMGLFERVTHEKTAYLHHSFDANASFPPFSDYEETFSNPLSPSLFTVYRVPSWAPEPSKLYTLAQTIYPYWREKRIQRAGHRIQPCLNYDESDTPNESYICFRRREIKAVRKTRASQVNSNDKLLRLHAELVQLEEIARLTLIREEAMLESTRKAQTVWDKRVAFVETMRKDPSLYNRADDELLVDKERVPKRPRVDINLRSTGLKIRPGRDAHENIAPVVDTVRPKERVRQVQLHMDRELARMKDEDRQWDDQVDGPYQSLAVPIPSRLYKFISPKDAAVPPRDAHAVRMRYGRGGRMHVDRRQAISSVRSYRDLLHRPELEDREDEGAARRLLSQWRFDSDDQPTVGPEGSDEKDRVLIDDQSPRYSHHIPALYAPSDFMDINIANEIPVTHPDGRPRLVQPFRLGPRREFMPRQSIPGSLPPAATLPLPQHGAPMNGTPVSHVQRMPPPPNGMRVPSSGHGPISGLIMGGGTTASSSSPSPFSTNGTSTSSDREMSAPLRANQHRNATPPNTNPYPPTKIPHIIPMEGFPANGAWLQQGGNGNLSMEQKQSLKAVLAAQGPRTDVRVPYIPQGNLHMNLTMPPARAMQYAKRANVMDVPMNGIELLPTSHHMLPPPLHINGTPSPPKFSHSSLPSHASYM